MCPPSMSSPLLRSRMASSGNAAGKQPISSSSGAGGAQAAAQAPQARNLRSVATAASSTSEPPPPKRKRSLVARLGQSFNPSGIALFGRILLTSSSAPLLLPHLTVRDVSALDWRALAAAGFRAAVFDKDNTLTAPYSLELTPEATAALADAAKAFSRNGSSNMNSKSKLALLSNSAGLKQYDPEGHEADALEAALGIAVIRHSTKKPSGDAAAIVAHFSSSSSSSGPASDSQISSSEIVMVGDRYLTDVAFGNRLGMLTVRVDPVEKSGKGEPRAVRASRAVEEALVRRRERKGMRAPEQELVERKRKGSSSSTQEVLEGFVRR